MKALVAGMGAGAAVGLTGLIVGLSLAPVRDLGAVSDQRDPTVAEPMVDEVFGAESGAPTPDAEEASDPIVREPEAVVRDGGVGADSEADQTDHKPIAGQIDGVNAEVRVKDDVAAEISGGEAAPDGLENGVSTAPNDAVASYRAAAELVPEAETDAAEPGQTKPASLTWEEEALAAPAPNAQTIAPRSLSPVNVRTTLPGVDPDPRTDRPGDEAAERPAGLAVPEAGLAPPVFDSALPPGPESAQVAPADEATRSNEEAMQDLPALVRNAAAEPPSGDVPLMAIVVVDRAGTDPIRDVPLSVAIAADAENAGERAEAWRVEGAEIVAIPGLAASTVGTGTIDLFEATFNVLPHAATVMAEGARGLNGGPVAADELAATLAETGHGLIMQSGGLDSLARAAERVGVPTVGIFRRVDGSDRDGRAVGRFLEQAAFEARNRGAVVVIADNSAETAEGIARFLGSARADTVALVPVSAILRTE